MNILITGGTGFIGRAVLKQLESEGNQITLISRRKYIVPIFCQITILSSLSSFENLDEFDAVINLAGEPIFDKRWDEAQKQCLLDSRVHITQQLVELINRSNQPPHTLFPVLPPVITVIMIKLHSLKMPAADDFQGQLCKQWEDTALQANTESVYYAPA